MRKKILASVLGCMVVGTAAYNGYRSHATYESNYTSDLLLANVEALAEGSDPDNPSTDNSSSAWTIEKCHAQGGNWNESTRFIKSTTIEAECKTAGQISVWGYTIVSAEFQRKKSYPIIICEYTCQPSTGNCCIKQGAYYGEQKLG